MGTQLEFESRQDAERIRILFIEHDPGCAELVCTCLRKAPLGTFEVSQAERLVAARERLQDQAYDALLVDLAHVEGGRNAAMDAATELAGRLPVIVLTGTEDDTLGACGDPLERVERSDLARKILRAVRRHRRMLGAMLAPTFVRVPADR